MKQCLKLKLLRLLAVTICAGQFTAGAPVSFIRITTLIPQADAIVVATAQGTVTNGAASATLNIERTLKGDLIPRSVLSVLWQSQGFSRSFSRPIISRRGLFFLRKEAGAWVVMPCMLGSLDFEETFAFLPAGEQPQEFKAAAGASIADKVMLEIAWAKQGGAPPGGASVDLVSEYRGSPSATIKQILTGFSQSSVPLLRRIGVRALLSDGDVSTLQRIETQQSTLLQSAGPDDFIDEIKYRFSAADPAALRVLGRIVTSPTSMPQLKEAAAGSLVRLHSSETLPYLATLFDHTSVTLQTYAVGGFSRFANNINSATNHPEPGDWPYRTDETMQHSGMVSSNVDFWRRWWLANQAKITGGR